MKNIIKRGTSLLLVLAMLLSFAAVVGAADERLPVEGEKPVTLSLDSVVLRQGSTDVQYVPVRLTIEPGFAITGFQLAAVSSDESAVEVTGFYPKRPLKIYEDGSVNYDETIGTIFGKLYSNYGSSESKDPVQKFACANGKGVTSETISTRAEDGVIKEPDLAGYIGVKVKDGAQSGAYQLSIIPNASRDRDTTKRNDIVFTIGTQNTYTDAYATLNAGTAIVLPEGASLPTVILTKTAFAAPTQAGLAVGGEAAGDYDLTKYVKLVTEEGLVDVTSLSVTVNGDKSVSLKQGNVLSLATTAEKDKGYKLTVTAANGSAFDPAVELPFTVSKQDSAFTMAGFTKNGGYSMDFAGPYEAPAYSGTTANKFVPLDPKAYDQYGMPMGQATTELKLYSDAACTKEITSGNAFESVTVSESTGSVQISKNLQADVWCKVRASATINGVTKTSDWITFQIKSNYPQPRKAILSLTDGTNPVSSNIIEIPAIGAPDKTITFSVDHFIDQFGHTMDTNTKPESYTVNFKVPTTTTVPGVEGTSNGTSGTITVTSTAASNAPITGTFTVMVEGKSIPNYLTAEAAEAETPTATLTIKKADPIASSLASMENGTGDYQKSKILPATQDGNMPQLELPGIRSTDVTKLELAPLYALDQYENRYTTISMTKCFSLYKVDGTTETKIDSDCVNFEKVGDTHVKLLLTNKLGTDGKLVLTKGTYKIKAEWSLTEDSPVLTASSAAFELKEAASVYTGTALYSNNAIADVPYIYGTPEGKTSSVTVTATFKNQYGVMPVSGIPMYTLDEESIKLNGKAIENKAVTYNKTGEQITFRVNSSAAQCFTNDEPIKLEATMSAKFDDVTVQNIPISITLRKDASKLAHLKVTGTASDGTTGFTKEATILDKDETASYNLIVPNTGSRTYTIALSDVEDQYGTALTDKVSRAVVTSGLTAADALKYDKATKTLTVRSDAAGGKAVLTFTESGTTTGHKVELTLNFAQMSFVNSDGADYKVGMWLNTNPKDYAGQTWAELYNQIKWGAAAYPTVHIENEDGTAGQDVTSSVKVVVKKDGAEVFDSSKTYTEQPKANAGTYTIELIYVKDEGEGKTNSYPIDSFTNFTISPKTVKITVNGAITKEYDGTANLPDVTLAVTAYETLNVDKSVLKFAQENVGTDINVELTSADANCLKTASGEPATNYTADLSELKGTITARKLIVTPNKQTFTYGQDTEINAALASEYTVSNNLEGTKAAKITGSMKLTTTSGADVTVYNAGTYNVANKDLSAGTNYEIEFPAKPVQWTISKKSVDPFNVTLEADFGVYGSELYAMMKAAKVTVDGQEVNFNTLYNVAALDIKDAGGNKVSREGTDSVNAGEYTVTGLALTTLDSANYEFKTAPTLKIKVKPHVLTDADVQLSGETSAGFDGTKKTVTVTVSFTYNRRPVTLTENTDYTITGEVEASNAGGHYLTVTAKPNGNLSGSVQKRWQIWPYEIQPGDLTFKLKSGVTFTYDTTPKKPQKSDVTWDVTATDAKRKAFLKTYFTEDDFNLDCLARTDAGDYTASASMRHNFVKSKEIFKMGVSWTIGKSSVRPLSNQTAKTKYGQPGSLTVTLSEGQYKGLTNGAWTVRDIGDIFESAVAEYKDGVVTINWKLKDTTKAGDTGSFKVIVPASTNYEGYEFTVTVNVTAKDAQTGFGFTYANPIVGYAEDTYTNPVQNAKTTPVYTSSNESVATVDSNGVVTIKDVGENVTITATAPENGEYASATDSYTLTVVPSTLTVTASSATMTANDSVPSFTASVTGLKRGQTTSQVFQTLSASAATDGKTAGTYAVNASATLKTDFVPRYTLRFVPGTLTVNPAVTVIDTVLPIIIGGNTCANGYANCACESFYDLDASRWYHEAIDWAYSLGLMNGTTKSTFGPNAAATRAQTWTMLARIAGQDTRRSSTWYEVGQKWAMNLGITDGTNPMGSLTREQLAAMLYRYVGSPAVNGTLTFTDSANVSTWARNAMIWAVQNGILDGVGGNRLNPKGTTTRAQAAAIFMRFSKLINK